MAAVPVTLPTVQSSSLETYDDSSPDPVTPPSFDSDLRVVSMRGPLSQITSAGVKQQVMIVTVGNFGSEATTSASLFLDEDTHGHSVGSSKLALPHLAPGEKVTLTVPFTVPPKLQGQLCFTARLEFSDTAKSAIDEAK